MEIDFPMPPAVPPPKRIRAWQIVLLVCLALLVPVGLVVVLFPLLSEQAFESADELSAENVESVRVFLLNRKELDGSNSDVGPYFAAPDDFDAILASLKSVPEVEQYPDARGPWLGELRVRLKNGRKGTIKLYWTRKPGEVARLRFQIGNRKFEGGSAEAFVKIAVDAEGRGRADKR